MFYVIGQLLMGSLQYVSSKVRVVLDDISDPKLMVTPGSIVDSTFHSHEWMVNNVAATVTNQIIDNSEISIATWDISITRQHSFYVATAIAPEIIVTVISIVAIFNHDLQARLLIAVTCLLTIIAGILFKNLIFFCT